MVRGLAVARGDPDQTTAAEWKQVIAAGFGFGMPPASAARPDSVMLRASMPRDPAIVGAMEAARIPLVNKAAATARDGSLSRTGSVVDPADNRRTKEVTFTAANVPADWQETRLTSVSTQVQAAFDAALVPSGAAKAALQRANSVGTLVLVPLMQRLMLAMPADGYDEAWAAWAEIWNLITHDRTVVITDRVTRLAAAVDAPMSVAEARPFMTTRALVPRCLYDELARRALSSASGVKQLSGKHLVPSAPGDAPGRGSNRSRPPAPSASPAAGSSGGASSAARH
jgi:hypothetical protein